jgi:GNAT superfamily N-acetyltransferase
MRHQSIQVRRAAIADVDTIVDFNAAMAWETENIILPRQRLTDGVNAVFEDSKKGFYVVAESDGTVVGQMMITYEWSDWRNAVFWWIQSVYVLSSHRRIGVFRALFEYVKYLAESAPDVCGLRLYVASGNQPAQQVYQSLNMKKSHYEIYEMSFDQS